MESGKTGFLFPECLVIFRPGFIMHT
jgi:hypothetical protein